jgi:hypothetical protein
LTKVSEKPTTSLILTSEGINAFPHIRNKTSVSMLINLFNILLEVECNKAEEKIEGILIGKDELKLLLLINDCCCRNFKNCIKKLPELTST